MKNFPLNSLYFVLAKKLSKVNFVELKLAYSPFETFPLNFMLWRFNFDLLNFKLLSNSFHFGSLTKEDKLRSKSYEQEEKRSLAKKKYFKASPCL